MGEVVGMRLKKGEVVGMNSKKWGKAVGIQVGFSQEIMRFGLESGKAVGI
jgi:hypothetical protein